MSQRQLQIFLNDILAYESGIHPGSFDWYVQNYNAPAIEYVVVDHPGRIRRNPINGDHQLEKMTIKQYFRSLGVDHLFDRTRPSCIKKMQHSCINPWGFVGYQLGEMILFKVGYYLPKETALEIEAGGACTITTPQIYVGEISNRQWTNGNRHAPHKLACCKKDIVATDVNQWCGQFTGLNGLTDFEHLKDPVLQTIVFLDTLRHNIYELGALFENDDKCLKDALADLSGKRSHAPVSLSGVLASTHLRGSVNTYITLTNGTDSRDELNTSIFDYLEMFSGYGFDIEDVESHAEVLKGRQLGHGEDGRYVKA